MTLEARVADLEKRLTRMVQRAVVVKGPVEEPGPYVVSINDMYGNTTYVPEVIFRPFVNELEFTVTIPDHDISVGMFTDEQDDIITRLEAYDLALKKFRISQKAEPEASYPYWSPVYPEEESGLDLTPNAGFWEFVIDLPTHKELLAANMEALPSSEDSIVIASRSVGDHGSHSHTNTPHRHTTDIPEKEHVPVKVTVTLPVPQIGDRVLLWAPTGNPHDLALIVGRW